MKSLLHHRILQHLLFWCFYFVIYYFNYKRDEPVMTGVIVTLVSLPVYLCFTYTQLYYLIPQFLLKKKIIGYLFLTALLAKFCVTMAFFCYGYIISPLRDEYVFTWADVYGFRLHHIKAYFAILMICGLAVSIKLLKNWYLEKERSQQIEKANTLMELNVLKAQVHPHFLFNTLNNLYSLTLTQSSQAPLVVTHLSDLLRYMLYECNEKEVPLENELLLLKKYIELEKLRYGQRLDISFSASGDIDELMIAPLLLLPLVENSFKHGVSDELDQCWVNIHIHAAGDQFVFTLSNSYSGIQPDDAGGIGQQNTIKRLELIYPGQYDMMFHKEMDMYIVKLKMTLNKKPAAMPVTIYDHSPKLEVV